MQVQADLNLHIMYMFEGTFPLDTACITIMLSQNLTFSMMGKKKSEDDILKYLSYFLPENRL